MNTDLVDQHAHPRLIAAIAAVVLTASLALSGCGSDNAAQASPASEPAASAHDPIDATDWDPQPSLGLTVSTDAMSGWNVHVDRGGLTMAPEHASTDPVAGEGHMHLYVDDIKVGRLYGDWYHLGALEPGPHEIRVEANANNHAPLEIDGTPVEAIATVEEATGPAKSHMHPDAIEASAWDPAPTLELTVAQDPKSGWNVHFIHDGFNLAPEHASGDPVDGEGHLHLYVDDIKVARVYTDWFHLDGLKAGEHTIRAELTANNHAPIAVDGAPIEATTSVEETRTTDGPDSHGSDDHGSADHPAQGTSQAASAAGTDASIADVVYMIAVVNGTASGDTGRHEINLGDTVGIVVSADVADNVHVHGYDFMAPVTPGEDATIVFEADVPGVFEVELEGAGVALTELLVR